MPIFAGLVLFFKIFLFISLLKYVISVVCGFLAFGSFWAGFESLKKNDNFKDSKEHFKNGVVFSLVAYVAYLLVKNWEIIWSYLGQVF